MGGQNRYVAMIGGVGSGKTRLLAQAGLMLAYRNPGCVGAVVAPTYPMLRDVDQRTFEECWQQWGIPYIPHKAESSYTLPGAKAELIFRSCEHPHRLRGPNLAYVLGDEVQMWPDSETAPQESAVSILDARIRDPRARIKAMVLVGTPNGFDHVYQRFAEPNGKRRLPTAHLVHAPTWENKHTPGLADILKASYDPLLYRQEVGGEFVAVGGDRCYYAFNRASNLRAFENDPTMPLYLCCDWNRSPLVWEVVQEAEGDATRVIDEVCLSSEATTVLAAREFKRRYPGWQKQGLTIHGDASSQSKHTTGFSDFEILRDEFPGVIPRIRASNPAVIDRLNAMNARLQNAKGQAQLFVHPTRCPELVADLEQVQNKPGTREPDKDKDPRRTHAADALGYLVHWRHPIIASRGGAR